MVGFTGFLPLRALREDNASKSAIPPTAEPVQGLDVPTGFRAAWLSIGGGAFCSLYSITCRPLTEEIPFVTSCCLERLMPVYEVSLRVSLRIDVPLFVGGGGGTIDNKSAKSWPARLEAASEGRAEAFIGFIVLESGDGRSAFISGMPELGFRNFAGQENGTSDEGGAGD